MVKGYKKCLSDDLTKFVLVELEIPETAQWFTPTYMLPPHEDIYNLYFKNEPPKSRCEYATVTKIHGGEKKARSMHSRDFTYEVGQTVKPDKFDPCSDYACSNGIHFFLSKENAIKYENSMYTCVAGNKGNLHDLTTQWLRIEDAIVDKEEKENGNV